MKRHYSSYFALLLIVLIGSTSCSRQLAYHYPSSQGAMQTAAALPQQPYSPPAPAGITPSALPPAGASEAHVQVAPAAILPPARTAAALTRAALHTKHITNTEKISLQTPFRATNNTVYGGDPPVHHSRRAPSHGDDSDSWRIAKIIIGACCLSILLTMFVYVLFYAFIFAFLAPGLAALVGIGGLILAVVLTIFIVRVCFMDN